MVPMCDYQQAIDRFATALTELRDHIRNHDLIADGAEVLAQMEIALAFLGRTRELRSWIAGDDGKGSAIEAEWASGWDFIRDHIRGWWD